MEEGILDKIAKTMTKGIEYRQGWEEGHKDGYDKGFAEGYAKAKNKYRAKDFYDPLGEEE